MHPHFHELKIFQKDKTFIHNLSGGYELSQKKTKKISKNYPDKINRKNLIRNFIDSLIYKNSKKNPISTKEQFDLMSVCFAAEKSLINNKKVGQIDSKGGALYRENK